MAMFDLTGLTQTATTLVMSTLLQLGALSWRNLTVSVVQSAMIPCCWKYYLRAKKNVGDTKEKKICWLYKRKKNCWRYKTKKISVPRLWRVARYVPRWPGQSPAPGCVERVWCPFREHWRARCALPRRHQQSTCPQRYHCFIGEQDFFDGIYGCDETYIVVSRVVDLWIR